MDNLVRTLYRDYGKADNIRMFPSTEDGLRPVERRVIYSIYEIARDKFAKCAKVDGYITGNYHPHASCLHGDTKILLLNGEVKTIKELSKLEEPFWVFSCKENGEIVPGLAHSARKIKSVNKLCKIVLGNNETLLCTIDHKIMLRDGNYCEAENLKENDSLMPLSTRLEDGYKWYLDNSKKKPGGEKVCYMVIRNLINKNIDKLVKECKYHTHHINSNRVDDSPENLKLIYKSEHSSITAKNMGPNTWKLIGEKIKERYKNNEDFKQKLLNALKKGNDILFGSDSKIREKIRLKNSKLINDYNKIQVEDRIKKVVKEIIHNNMELNESNYESIRKNYYNYPKFNKLVEKFGSIENVLNEVNNHKVIKVEVIELDSLVGVYDISVEKYHNFAIEQGIFVHNCYGTIVQLANQDFLEKQGNFGSTIGVQECSAAAPRYTEIKLAKKTYDMALKYINYVPYVDSELGDGGKEPSFLPSMFPFCLVGTKYTTGIGFGYRTFIPCYKESDLYQRLLYLLKKRKDEPIISPITDCKILASNDELKQLLTTGKATIKVKGVYDIIGQKEQVALKSFLDSKFETFIGSKRFEPFFTNQDIGFIDLSTEKVGTHIVFEVLKQRNSADIFKRFKKVLDEELTGNISFEMIAVDKTGSVKTISVDEMLLNTYNVFTLINGTMLDEEIKQSQDLINEYKVLDKIRPSFAKNISKSSNLLSAEEIIKKINEETKVEISVISYLFSKYRISKLLNLNTDTTDLNNKINILKNNKSNIGTFVLNQYISFVK